MLLGQLEARDEIQAKRKRIWEYYYNQLAEWANENQVRLPMIPNYCEQTYNLFYLIMPSLEHRQGLITHLRENNIQSVFHYLPLHLSEMGLKFGGNEGNFPISELISEQLIRLPFFNYISVANLNSVVELTKEYKCD